MYNPDYYNWNTPTGWRCPVCGKVWAPHVSFCSYCNEERKTFTSIKVDDSGWWKQYVQQTMADSDINIKIDKNDAITHIGPMPEVQLENMGWRDWLDTTREQIRKEANLK